MGFDLVAAMARQTHLAQKAIVHSANSKRGELEAF
jgi:hypothetical protein